MRSYDALIGIIGCILATDFSSQISLYVSIICSAIITLMTCFVQAYRLWRDRDKDKGDKE